MQMDGLLIKRLIEICEMRFWLTSAFLWLSVAGVGGEAQTGCAVVALEAAAVEEHALRTHALHDVHALLAERAELAGRLGSQQDPGSLLQTNTSKSSTVGHNFITHNN